MRKVLLLCILVIFLFGCASQPEPDIPDPTLPTEEITESTGEAATDPPTEAVTEPPLDPIALEVEAMTTEEKVGQLFLARYDAANAMEHTQTLHLGGWILFSRDFENHTPASIRDEIAALQAAADTPLMFAVDEEGGTVTRVSRYPAFRESKFSSPRSLYKKGGPDAVLAAEAEKSQLLASLGINVNMAPVCDITTDPDAFMYRRSLGLTPEETGNVVSSMVQTMEEYGVGAVVKHFPGYGNNADTHVGIAHDSRSLGQLEECDLIPFSMAFDAGCGAVLVSHTVVECLDDTLPASLSPAVIGYIRNGMGFDGVVITDDLIMEAITDRYGAAEAAVMAVQAGCDILCSSEYVTQYEAVLTAAEEGRISPAALDGAVYRVLRWKASIFQ